MESAVIAAPVQSPPGVCSGCARRARCLPAALDDPQRRRLDGQLALGSRRVARGSALFQLGQRDNALYAVWSGCFKTSLLTREGAEHVTGFVLSAELLGLDALGDGVHRSDAVALEDSQVCVVPLSRLALWTRRLPGLQQQFHRMLGHEFLRQQESRSMLGSHNAEERLASFLIDLADRLQARGSPAGSVHLTMTREDIGNYLGLKVETVSRTLTRFQLGGLLEVRHRLIRFVDPAGLQCIADGADG